MKLKLKTKRFKKKISMRKRNKEFYKMTQFLKRNIIQFINNIFSILKFYSGLQNSLNSYGNLKRN